MNEENKGKAGKAYAKRGKLKTLPYKTSESDDSYEESDNKEESDDESLEDEAEGRGLKKKKKRKKYNLTAEGSRNKSIAQKAALADGSSNLAPQVMKAWSYGTIQKRFIDFIAEAALDHHRMGKYFRPIQAVGDTNVERGCLFFGKKGLAAMCRLLTLKYDSYSGHDDLHKQASCMRDYLTQGARLMFEETKETRGNGVQKKKLKLLPDDATFKFVRGKDFDVNSFDALVKKYPVDEKAPSGSMESDESDDDDDDSVDSAALVPV